MQKFALIAVVTAAALALGSAPVDAKRFGGGKSFGAQRSAPAQAAKAPPATPPSTAPAAGSTAPAAGAAAPAAAGAAAKSGLGKWAGPLAGIAAGLGLGYLFSQLGAGGFMGLLLIVGLGIVALIVFARSAARRGAPLTRAAGAANAGATSRNPSAEPMAFAGAPMGSTQAPVMASGLGGGFGIPSDFDKAGFENNAKKQFITLQGANDRGDLDAVRHFVTDELYNEIAKEVIGGNKDATEVDDLHAELLGIETERNLYWASVEFRGNLREDGKVMASPFREIWNLNKPLDGSRGWLVAGIQQG